MLDGVVLECKARPSLGLGWAVQYVLEHRPDRDKTTPLLSLITAGGQLWPELQMFEVRDAGTPCFRLYFVSLSESSSSCSYLNYKFAAKLLLGQQGVGAECFALVISRNKVFPGRPHRPVQFKARQWWRFNPQGRRHTRADCGAY